MAHYLLVGWSWWGGKEVFFKFTEAQFFHLWIGANNTHLSSHITPPGICSGWSFFLECLPLHLLLNNPYSHRLHISLQKLPGSPHIRMCVLLCIPPASCAIFLFLTLNIVYWNFIYVSLNEPGFPWRQKSCLHILDIPASNTLPGPGELLTKCL